MSPSSLPTSRFLHLPPLPDSSSPVCLEILPRVPRRAPQDSTASRWSQLTRSHHLPSDLYHPLLPHTRQPCGGSRRTSCPLPCPHSLPSHRHSGLPPPLSPLSDTCTEKHWCDPETSAAVRMFDRDGDNQTQLHHPLFLRDLCLCRFFLSLRRQRVSFD
jgi:hypothetical protein